MTHGRQQIATKEYTRAMEGKLQPGPLLVNMKIKIERTGGGWGCWYRKEKILGEPCTPEVTTQEYTTTKKGGSNRHRQNKTVKGANDKSMLTYQHAHTHTYLDAHICTHMYVDVCTYIYRQRHVNIRTYMHANVCMYAHRYA